VCLDPSVDKEARNLMEDGMENRIRWIKKMIPKGLEIIVAFDNPRQEKIHYKWFGKMLHSDLAVNDQVPMGLLEFIPIKDAPEPVQGKRSLFINCMWILPPFWNIGIGKALLESFIEKAKQVGSASLIAYEGDKWFGTSISYMPSSYFKRYGFQEVDRDGSRLLLYLDLGASNPPKFLSQRSINLNKFKKINLDLFFNSQCPWARYMINTVRGGIKKYNNININYVNTDNNEIIKNFGISRGVYLNGKPIFKRMASWEEIQSELEKVIKERQ
jgi:GNAT superfamily N-acetyltransferase